MDTPHTYIPIDRRLAMAAGRELPERTVGAALFADISGFTPLTELLARTLGPRRGAEELTRYLNEVYDALIGELYRYGGTVIGFSGDAITCWLDGDDGRRATAAGLAMQSAMAAFANLEIGGESVTLAMKAAVATGAARRFVVGDPDYLLVDVMAGHTLERLAEAEHHAERGEVVLDPDTADALDGVEIIEWREGRHAVVGRLSAPVEEQSWPALDVAALDDERTRSWLLPPVYRRLRAGQGDFLAELRPAVALFLRFAGIDYDGDPEAPAKLDHFIREVEAILARYDGSLIQLTIGDKGSYLYAAFGAPHAHEDDVDRAAATALALAELPSRLGYLEPLQIGITHGRMRVGAYGGTMRRTYGVLGDAVNLSARLMSAAQPGQILVDDEARARAGPHLLWEALPAVRVKGKSEPVTLNRLVHARRRASHSLEALFPTAPVGRVALLERLDVALEALEGGEGRVVRLVGEAGMGKSHLAAETVRRALGRGTAVALGSCQSVTQGSPYHPWRQLFSTLLGLDEVTPDALAASLRERIEREEPGWLLRLPLLGDLLGIEIPDNATTRALERDKRQEALFSLLVELLERWTASRPLLLVIENAQWADEASRALVTVVAKQVAGRAPLLLMLVTRPSSAPDDPLPDALEIEVGEMGPDEIAELVAHRLDGTVSPLLRDFVRQVAQGNPFFVGELLETLRRSGRLEPDEGGTWRVTGELLSRLQRADCVVQREGQWALREGVNLASVTLGLPDSINGLMLARLDRLPDAPKLTLKVCSVLGDEIDLDLVTRAHPERRPLDQIEGDVGTLVDEGVLRALPDGPGHYVFQHHTAREVTYEMLLHAQRRQLHHDVARAIAAVEPDAATRIAHHAFLGELWSLALPSNLAAGEAAAELHATHQSIESFHRALEAAARLPDPETAESRARIHLALGELQVVTAQYDEAEDHLAAARDLARARGDREGEARADRWMARALEQRGRYPEALEWLERAGAALGDAISREGAEIALLAGLIYVRQGAFTEAMALCERALGIGERLDDTAIRARTYNLMGIIDLRTESRAAIDRFEQSLEQYTALGDVYGQATSNNLIANGHFARGELSEADRHYRRALDLFIQTGNVYNQVVVSNNLGGIAIKQGRPDEALDYYENAVRRLTQIGGSAWVFGALRINLGQTRLERGEYAASEAELEEAARLFAQAEGRDLLPELYALWSELRWRQGDPAGAIREADRTIALAQELSMPREEARARGTLAEVALARGALGEAMAQLDEAERLCRDAGDQHGLAKLLLVRARLDLAREERAAARARLDESAAILEPMGARPDLERLERLRDEIGDAA